MKDSSMIPSAGETDSGGDYNPFLKANTIGKLGTKGVLGLTGEMRLRPEGNFGPEIIVGVRYKGKTYDLTVKIGSGNHGRLEKAVGLNSKKWKGKTLKFVIKHHLSNDYIALT